MTDTERIKMALPLLQALADGKQLQFRMPNDEWRAMELDCDAVLEQPTSYRIAPDLPPRPSVEDVLNLRTDDGRILRLTGEYRPFKRGEYFVSEFSMSVNRGNVDGTDPKWILEPLPDHRTAIPDGYEIEAGPMTWLEFVSNHEGKPCISFHSAWSFVSETSTYCHALIADDPTFILRPIAKPKPRYEPWDFQTVPMPLPVIFRCGTGYQIVAVFPVGFATIGGQQSGWKPDIHAWNDLKHYAQRDGLPCGRRVEA